MPPLVTERKNGVVGQKFRFFTGTVKAYKRASATAGEPEEMVIEGIASSNSRDRYGDTMTAQCQASLLKQSKALTMFGNHGTAEGLFGRSYRVPEDVYGYCGSSRLETDGDTIKLAIEMVIAQSNPRAVKSWELINKDGVRLAFSIGGTITDAEIDEENDDGGGWFPPLLINDMELLEISLVGIPANPDSYTRSFLEDIKKSFLKSATRDPGVQKAFLRSLGLKSVEDEFSDLATGALGDQRGVQLSKDCGGGVKVAAFCRHEPVCASYDEHDEKPEVEDPDTQCGHDGCDKPRAAGSTNCDEHPEATETVKYFPFEPKLAFASGFEGSEVLAALADGSSIAIVTTKNTQGDDVQVIELRPKSLITVDVELGEKTRKSIDDVIADVKKQLTAAEEQFAALQADIEAKSADKVALDATIVDLQKQIGTLKDEIKTLDEAKKASQLRATPTGRHTEAVTDGSSASTKALHEMTDAELAAYRRNMGSVETPDARKLGDGTQEQAR